MGVFDDHYHNNYWANDESVSGHGSTLDATAEIRRVLPLLFDHYDIKSVLDIPCGDYHWFAHMKLPQNITYIGADVVADLVMANRKQYPGVDFRLADIVSDPLPFVDLVFVRDLFGHLPNHKVKAALANVRRTKAKFLLATTFPTRETSGDIAEGEWRPINLARWWGLGDPEELINEHCTRPGYEDKALGLWRLR